MNKILSFLVIALFSFALFIPSNTVAVMIDDNYVGSNDYGYEDVIGNPDDFGIDWMDVSIVGNTLSVVIKTNYIGSDSLGAGTEYGDFFVSIDGWDPYGDAPYIEDNYLTGEDWEFAFDVQTGLLYDITNYQPNILLAEDVMPTLGYIFRTGQEVAIDTTGLLPYKPINSTMGSYDGTYYSFVIDFTGVILFNNLNWDSLDLGFHWAAATCGNDVIEGSAAPIPEPATMLLFGTGLIGMAGIGRKMFFK